MNKEPTLWDQVENSGRMDFREARAYARSLNIKNREEWNDYVKEHGSELPGNLPLKPDEAYRHLGWKGWNDWLGVADEPEKPARSDPQPATGSSGPDLWEASPANPYLPFSKAREKAREQGFEYKEEWEAYARGLFRNRPILPEGVPPDPEKAYRHTGWKGWTDWLVSPEKRKDYSPFHHAREFVRSWRLKSKTEWVNQALHIQETARAYGLLIPLKPHLEYEGSGWESWEDWLGTNIEYRSFYDTRRFVHTLELKSREEWFLYCQGLLVSHPRKPRNIYAYPDIAYKKEGWRGWDDWLGNVRYG